MASINIVESKWYNGLIEIEKQHQSFFKENNIKISDCYVFQYIAGNKRKPSRASYYISGNYNKIPNEIKIIIESFIHEFFDWIRQQNFQD